MSKQSSITLTLTELRDMIAPVLPHADKGAILPLPGHRAETRVLTVTGVAASGGTR